MFEPQIIFEDSTILVIDKPANWVVNESKTTKNIPVVQSWLRKRFNYEIVRDRELRSGIVHRLDKETSGILLVAKNKKSFLDLQKQFKERQVKKNYIALVHGKVEPEKGEIRLPIARLPWNRERFGVFIGGREAITEYRLLKNYRYNSNDFSLVELKPKTGRTHQLRVHLKYLGYPIVSDKFYLGRRFNKEDREWCPRLFLHASKISFIHPFTLKKITFESKIPKDLEKCLKFLDKN